MPFYDCLFLKTHSLECCTAVGRWDSFHDKRVKQQNNLKLVIVNFCHYHFILSPFTCMSLPVRLMQVATHKLRILYAGMYVHSLWMVVTFFFFLDSNNRNKL